MIADAIACLRCPHCAEPLVERERVLGCANGHAFDVARQGYANLLARSEPPGTADTASMVAARDAFLRAGHFAPIAQAAAAAAVSMLAGGIAGCVVEVGAGTGYYLAQVLDASPGRVGLALDISKQAARRAAKAHPRAAAVVGDTWASLPVQDGAAALVLDVFAPRNPAEFARILAPGGSLVVVTPTPAHLIELVDVLGMLHVPEDKRDRLDESLAAEFALIERSECEYAMALAHSEVAELLAMGPSAWHADEAASGRAIARLPEPAYVTASVTLSVYARRQ